jgi:hypothetical protein
MSIRSCWTVLYPRCLLYYTHLNTLPGCFIHSHVIYIIQATSACDLASERQMYTLLSRTCVSWVSVGHRPSLEPFHKQRLTLLGNNHGNDSASDGAWTMSAIHVSAKPGLQNLASELAKTAVASSLEKLNR